MIAGYVIVENQRHTRRGITLNMLAHSLTHIYREPIMCQTLDYEDETSFHCQGWGGRRCSGHMSVWLLGIGAPFLLGKAPPWVGNWTLSPWEWSGGGCLAAGMSP